MIRSVTFITLAALALTGCVGGGGGGGRGVTTVVEGAVVEPGHASCLASIGREDVALNPEAPMSTAEIGEFIECVGTRAAR